MYCKGLTELDLSSFDTSNVTKMNYMFYDCLKLTTIYISDLWNTNSVTSSDNMFYNCTSLVGAISYNDSKRDKTASTTE